MKRIALISPYCPFPPLGGGKSRIYNLFKSIAEAGIYVDMVAMEQETVDVQNGDFDIAPGFHQHSVPKSPEHKRKDDEIDKKCGVFIYDASLIYNAQLTPAFAEAAKSVIQKADAVVMACNPYLFYAVQPFLGDKPLYYDAHDVAYHVKRNLLKGNTGSFAKQFLSDLFNVEKECCERCAKIFACSEEDGDTMAEIFGVPRERFVVAANGVDAKATFYTNVEKRLANKKKLGIEGEQTAIFLGSAHYPNFEACDHIIAFADKCPDTWFFLIGSQCNNYRNIELPANVGLLGLVTEEQKNAILSVVDIALNPVVSGSGSNVKNFDYMAAGLPVIAAEFALRGIGETEHFMVAEPKDMPPLINSFRLEEQAKRVEAARRYVEEEFDWGVIAGKSMLSELLAN